MLAHDTIIDTADPGTRFCYTDGSASPNPGPAGAGASLFVPSLHSVIDLGAPLGFGSNNLGELVAIGILLDELLTLLVSLPRPPHVVIFTDSLYASSAVTSSKVPAAHAPSIRALRRLFAEVVKLAPVTFHWIRGHSGAGGNERVDRIAKIYANLSIDQPPRPPPTSFPSHRTLTPWPFNLSTAPAHAFLHMLPKACWNNKTLVTEAKEHQVIEAKKHCVTEAKEQLTEAKELSTEAKEQLTEAKERLTEAKEQSAEAKEH